ncbi:four helix bundle suffix domain-containing protein [Patescibacteria group bacterium]|nr:four helix bundle suffix domain-containing protein [Patescibacteria group bacterium]
MVSKLPPHKYLLSYRYTELTHDGTVQFTARFLSDIIHRRTREQMDQAARSGKQNIVEGFGRDLTSKKSEITLLDVARMSLEELTTDYEDFLRQRNLAIWPKNDPRIMRFRELGFRLSNEINLDKSGTFKEKLALPADSEVAANLMLTLCHQASYLLFRQIKAVENRLIQEGGYSENLYRRREEFRRNNLK